MGAIAVRRQNGIVWRAGGGGAQCPFQHLENVAIVGESRCLGLSRSPKSLNEIDGSDGAVYVVQYGKVKITQIINTNQFRIDRS